MPSSHTHLKMEKLYGAELVEVRTKMPIDDVQFSAREKETINLLLQGKSNKQIALDLGVSVSTIEFHLKNVYRKLQVKSRTEAVLRLGESIGSDETSKKGQSIGDKADNPGESIVDEMGVSAENGSHTISHRRIPMKQKLYLIVGGSLLAIVLVLTGIIFTNLNRIKAYASPQSTLEVSVTASGEMSDMGTSFILPPGLGDGTQNEIVPQNDGPISLWPRHTKLTLVDYPLQGTTLEPQILVYPAPEFAQMSDCSKATIDGLKDLLTTQQVSSVMPNTCVSVADSLPFLPNMDAREVFHAQVKFLSFRNGTGIRYLTQYGQAAFPAVNNSDLFYTFQGLTSDGKYYVSVILPINLPGLAADYGPESWKNPADWQSADNFPGYIEDMVIKLNQADNPFNPSLESLDALVQSLLIDKQP